MENIYQSVKYFFYVLKSLGLASYQFDKRSKSFEMSLSNYFQLVAAILIWTFLFGLQVENFDEASYETGSQSWILELIWKYQYSIQYLFSIFVTIFSFMRRKNVENFLKLIDEFDQTMEKSNWKFKMTQFKFLPVATCTIAAITVSVNMMVAVYRTEFYGNVEISNTYIILRTLSYVAVTEFYLMLSLQFILSSYCIQERLTAMIINVR